MKTIFIKYTGVALLFIMLATGLQLSAQINQPNQSPREKIEALRIAFISQQLNLTPDEAQKFWPVYNAYRAELQGIQKAYPPQPTADQQIELEQKKLDLKKKYKPQFEAALGTEKLNMLYNIERKFQEKLREIREQRMQQRGGMPSSRPIR